MDEISLFYRSIIYRLTFYFKEYQRSICSTFKTYRFLGWDAMSSTCHLTFLFNLGEPIWRRFFSALQGRIQSDLMKNFVSIEDGGDDKSRGQDLHGKEDTDLSKLLFITVLKSFDASVLCSKVIKEPSISKVL